MYKANFNFHGLGIKVQSENQELVEEIVRDFKFFMSGEAEADITVRIRLSPPQYEGLPDLPAQFITPRNVCYTDQGKVYIDYNGRALSIHDRPNQICTIESEDFDLAREIGYLFILSATGQYFDDKHLHRIHALGISREGQAAILLPSGEGRAPWPYDYCRGLDSDC